MLSAPMKSSSAKRSPLRLICRWRHVRSRCSMWSATVFALGPNPSLNRTNAGGLLCSIFMLL